MRINSIPRVYANCLATSVLPTPVGPLNMKLPIGLLSGPNPLLAILIADERELIALS